jgi:hypothetical protein
MVVGGIYHAGLIVIGIMAEADLTGNIWWGDPRFRLLILFSSENIVKG